MHTVASTTAELYNMYNISTAYFILYRPTLKKNLARIAMYPPQPSQPSQSSTFDPDFPELPNSKGSVNKYHFIPTQFRTQPVNLPGSVGHRIHDKGKNFLSNLNESIQRQHQSGIKTRFELLAHLPFFFFHY